MSDTTIRIRDNGPLLVEGPLTLQDAEGALFALEAGKNYALCRCGGSANRPFCDGSHKANGFQCAVRAPQS